MEAYSDFAKVYDIFMDETPYQAWRDVLLDILRENKITDGIIAELGCGTGVMTELLADQGYDMIGIDNSEEMLGIAAEKRSAKNSSILYLNQDMRELELYGTARAMISICDSVNYLTEPEDVVRMMKLVNNYLDPGGLFILDFNTVHKYRDVIGDTTIAENREDCSFIWDNYYDEEERINEYAITFFVREEKELFRRFTEIHYQRGYTLEEMKRFAGEAGLLYVAAYDGYSGRVAGADSERILLVLREQGK